MLAGRLFQLAIVQGKMLCWMNCLVIGELKSSRMHVSGGSRQGYKLGEEVQGDYAIKCFMWGLLHCNVIDFYYLVSFLLLLHAEGNVIYYYYISSYYYYIFHRNYFLSIKHFTYLNTYIDSD